MPKNENPFHPRPSLMPLHWAGREDESTAAATLVQALARGQANRGLSLQGLRGSGKTALLGKLASIAHEAGLAIRYLYGPRQLTTELLPGPCLYLVDEAATWGPRGLAALAQAQEQWMSQGLPRALALAGLPCLEQLDELERRRFSRVLEPLALNPLSTDECSRWFQAACPLSWQPAAFQEAYRQSKGWPALVQAWGWGAYESSKGSEINAESLRLASPKVLAHLDREFYGPGFDRLSPRERAYLRSMAHLGTGPHRSSDIANSMDTKITSLGPLRAKLITGGWIYSPGHGLQAFAAPGMDEFMRRVMPNFK